MVPVEGPGASVPEALLRLLVAGVIGGLIGYERQVHNQAIGIAGLVLVAMGSTVYMLLAQYLAATDPSAPGRAVQGILQGIGFLGGAVIFKGGTNVRGIKTAASIWLLGAVGLSLGTVSWWLGVIAGVAMALLLFVADLFNPRQGGETPRAGGSPERQE